MAKTLLACLILAFEKILLTGAQTTVTTVRGPTIDDLVEFESTWFQVEFQALQVATGTAVGAVFGRGSWASAPAQCLCQEAPGLGV